MKFTLQKAELRRKTKSSLAISFNEIMFFGIVLSMKTSWLSKFLIFVSALTLSGCSMINMFPDRADQISDGVGSVPPSELDKEESVLPISLRQIGLTTQSDYLPSKGEVNLLVLPIEFTDAPFSAQTLKDINVALNRKSSETGYWESVSSFYEKSSFGQLHLTYTIADVYETGKTQQQVVSHRPL